MQHATMLINQESQEPQTAKTRFGKQISFESAMSIFSQPFMELLYNARSVHIQHFSPNTIQTSTLLSIKTGQCSEDCSYCAQSSRYQTDIQSHSLLDSQTILEYASIAKKNGSKRFCMGASGRSPSNKELDSICKTIAKVKEMGLETCATLGLLTEQQAQKLKESGLDFYNHNIDTSAKYYPSVITTRTLQDRLDTISFARNAGLKICVGGILGMGESNEDRVQMLCLLANLPIQPESIPINRLVKIPGTPLANNSQTTSDIEDSHAMDINANLQCSNTKPQHISRNNSQESDGDLDCFDFVRIIATARILMPKSYIRLSAGRNTMSDSMQALCLFAGANSVFYGDKLLTAKNTQTNQDDLLFSRLNLTKETFIESEI